MDNGKVESASISDLKDFISNTLRVDLPLYYNNPGSSVKIDFAGLDTPLAYTLARQIIMQLFADELFWICEYGSCSDRTFKEHHFFNVPLDVTVFPFEFKFIDSDWFEYEHKSIVCARVFLRDFRLDDYIKYAFRLEFISNSIFLISTKRKIAISIYDRRGMDITAADSSVLQQIESDYSDYIIGRSLHTSL